MTSSRKSRLLDRLESYFDFDGRMSEGRTQRREDAKEVGKEPDLSVFASIREICVCSVAKLADVARQDNQFMEGDSSRIFDGKWLREVLGESDGGDAVTT